MNKSTYRKTLDVQKQGVQFTVTARKNEALSRQIILNIVEGGKPFDFGNGSLTAVLYATKPDGTFVYNACTVDENTVTYVFTQQTLVAAGEVNARLYIVATDDVETALEAIQYNAEQDSSVIQVLYSPEFIIYVEDVPSYNSAVESTNEYTALTTATAEAREAIINANAATENAAVAAGAAKEAAEYAEEKATLAQTAATNADTKAKAAQTAATAANNAASLAETKAGLADTAATNANTAINNLDITATRITGGLKITITDKNGTAREFAVNDGATGATGEPGPQGEPGPRGEPGPQGDAGKDYVLTNEDLQKISTLVEVPTKTSELQNDSNFVSDENYIHTDNNFTTVEKQKLGTLANYDDTAIKKQIAEKQNKLSTEQLNNISAVPDKIDKSQVGNGLKFADGMLQLDIPVASASTTYGGDVQ